MQGKRNFLLISLLLFVIGACISTGCTSSKESSNAPFTQATPTQTTSTTSVDYKPIDPAILKTYLPPAPSGWKANEEGSLTTVEVDVALATRTYSLISNPQKTAEVTIIAYPTPHRVGATTNCTNTQIAGNPGFICDVRDSQRPSSWTYLKGFAIKERIYVRCLVFNGQLSDVDLFVNAIDITGLTNLVSSTSSPVKTNVPLPGQGSSVKTVGLSSVGQNQYYKGAEVRFYGTCTKCDVVYLFLAGQGISSNGGPLTDPKRIAVNPANPSTYTVVNVMADSTFQYRWNTSTVGINYGTYTLYATSVPLSALSLNDANCPINVVKQMSDTNCAKMRFNLMEPFKVCCPNGSCWYSYEASPPPKC